MVREPQCVEEAQQDRKVREPGPKRVAFGALEVVRRVSLYFDVCELG